MKKIEIFLSILVLVVAIFWFIGSNVFIKKLDGQVQVIVDGEIYGSYDMCENQTIRVENQYGYNVIEIQDGRVYVSEADCRDLLCAKMHPISKENQVICCLPHRLLIKVIHKTESDMVDDTTY